MIDPREFQQFRDDIVQRLARLETKVDSLLTNGLVSQIQERIHRHDRLIWMAIGGLAVIGPIVAYLALRVLVVTTK